MNKLTVILALFMFSTAAQAQSVNPFSTEGDMGYEADGLDLWDLAVDQDPTAALGAFNLKCATEIPARITSFFPEIGLDKNDFSIETSVYSYNIRGLGKSYRCYVYVTIKEPRFYKFTRWQASDQFFDIRDPSTGETTKTSRAQCEEYSQNLDSNRETNQVFDRHSLLQWVKKYNPATGRNGLLEMCYVTYIQVKRTREPAQPATPKL